jgi:phthiocerol/phenolphthiocerol synthesis type-I polyketide synthase A
LWRSYGVQPDAVIGHSMGEVTAAVVAGALSPADGLKVIEVRSKLMSRLAGQGAVALLELEAEAAEVLLVDYPDVSVAGYLSPRQTVVAGPVAEVDAVIAAVSEQERFARRVNMEVASHTAFMDPILPELRTALADVTPESPKIPFISTVTDTNGPAPVLDAEYWTANVRQPARLRQAITAAAQKHVTFIEISAHPILTHAITETLESIHHHSIATLYRDGDDTLGFRTNLNSVHANDYRQTPHPAGPHPVLPTTPWQHRQHWISVENGTKAAEAAPGPGSLLGAHIAVAATPPAHLWQARLVPEARPYPGSHRHHGVELVPASVLLQTLSTAAAECDASILSDIRFQHPIVVDRPLLIQVVADGEQVTVSSSPADAIPARRWVKHLSARITYGHEAEGSEDPRNGGHETLDPDTADKEFVDESVTSLWRAWGSVGRPFTWSVISCRSSAHDTLHADIEIPDASTVALLDAVGHIARMVDSANPQLLVPATIESFWCDAEVADDHARIEVFRRGGDDDELIVDVAVKSPDGQTRVDIRSLRYAAVWSGPVPATSAEDPRALAHVIEWQPARPADEHAQQAPDTPCTVAVVGESADAYTLSDRLASVGHPQADIDEAQCVLYLAEPDEDADRSDIDSAARLSAEVSTLVRRLAQRDDNPPKLWIITRGVREAASDAAVRQSCLWGLAGVIRAEQPELCGGLVDIPPGPDFPDDDCVAALSTVLHTSAKSILTLRDGEFFAPVLAPVSGEPVRKALRCQPDVAYLITGGMGALGLLMAAWLVDHGARRLVLAGRTGLPPRRDWDSATDDADVRHKIAAIRTLERRGVSVDAVALDIASAEALRALLARRDDDGAPPIRGVIHAAGVTEGQLLTEMDDSRLRRTMWPKVAGAQALHEAFPPGSLDFCYLTAAAGAVFGVPGQGAYAAANAYLDGLGRARHRQGCHTVSLDWAAWRGLGFGADAQVAVQELERMGSRPINPDEAFTAWEHLHRYDIGQAVMAPISASDPDSNAPAKAWSQMPAENMLSELEIGLRIILARELRMSEAELELDRPFAELGINSVMAMTVRRETEQFVGIELSATMLWNHPTITTLATHLVKKLSPQDVSDNDREGLPDSASSVLNELFDHVESTPAGLDGI